MNFSPTHTGLLSFSFKFWFFADYYPNTEFAKRLSDMVTEFFIELEEQSIEIGADIILEGEDYCGNHGLWMKKEQLKEFVLPGLRKAIMVAKDAGIFFLNIATVMFPPFSISLSKRISIA